MKKIYFLSALFFAAISANAQILESDNFDSYNIGNVGTDTTGTIAGQGGYFTIKGNNEDYQIVNIDAGHGKSLQLSSVALQSSTSNRVMYRNVLENAWTNRTPGNNILKGSFQIYTANSAGGKLIGSEISNLIGIYYNSLTRKFQCYALVETGYTNSYYADLPEYFSNTYPPNTWIPVAYTYNPLGIITFTVNGVMKTVVQVGPNSIAKNAIPQYHRIGMYNYDENNTTTVGTTMAVDNFKLEAVPSLLSTSEMNSALSELIIYPNPTTNVLNLKTTSKINNVQIIDMAGKVLSSRKVINNQVNVRNLPIGNYTLNVNTNNGTQSKKFIKQ